MRTVLLACAVVCATVSLSAGRQRDPKREAGSPAQPGIPITVHTPERRELVLALDELDLGPRSGAPAVTTAPRLPPSATVATQRGARSTLRVSGADTRHELLDLTSSIAAANPGIEVSWVVYEPGRPRSPSTRALLTREIGLIVEDDVRVHAIVGDLGVVRAIPGVPNGYVLEASDPQAALELVTRLRERSGVRTAYTLLKRQMFTR